jgi:hypothetical protein
MGVTNMDLELLKIIEKIITPYFKYYDVSDGEIYKISKKLYRELDIYIHLLIREELDKIFSKNN